MIELKNAVNTTICVNNKKKGIYNLPDKGAKMSLSGCLKLVAFHAILIVYNNSLLSKEPGKCALISLKMGHYSWKVPGMLRQFSTSSKEVLGGNYSSLADCQVIVAYC